MLFMMNYFAIAQEMLNNVQQTLASSEVRYVEGEEISNHDHTSEEVRKVLQLEDYEYIDDVQIVSQFDADEDEFEEFKLVLQISSNVKNYWYDEEHEYDRETSRYHNYERVITLNLFVDDDLEKINYIIDCLEDTGLDVCDVTYGGNLLCEVETSEVCNSTVYISFEDAIEWYFDTVVDLQHSAKLIYSR